MSPTTPEVEYSPLVLHLNPIINLSDDQFFEFCQMNRDLRIERNATGERVMMRNVGITLLLLAVRLCYLD